MEPRFSVHNFNELINSTLGAIGDVIVEGEITQLSISSKGGVNIVIKDPLKPALLNVSGYAPRVEGIKIVAEGMKVAAYGIPNLWSQGGKFSLQIYRILPLGAGALKEAYEKLKQTLALEGLFAESRKRPLPEFITRIALLSGKDSAAESDFLKILKENQVGVEVAFYPVQVQGKYAEDEIIKALKMADKEGFDAIALVRGGGSLEDLITFNSERVARTIFASKTPIIVGVGHEKDESIADFVADIRASTPSQAAYYIAMNNQRFIDSQIIKTEFILQNLERRLDLINNSFESKKQTIKQKLILKVEINKAKIAKLIFNTKTFKMSLMNIFKDIQNGLRILDSINPKAILKRGYSIVLKNGKIIKNSTDLKVADEINIELASGSIDTKVLKIIK